MAEAACLPDPDGGRHCAPGRVCDGLVNICCSCSAAHLSDRRVVTFYDHVNAGDMNTFLSTAEAYRHIFIYFHDNDLGGLADSSHMGCVRSEVEETVLVHRGNLEDSDIRFVLGLLIMIPMVVMMGYRDADLLSGVLAYQTPVAVSSYIMAQQAGADGQLAGQLVVFSSVLSIFTLFVTIFILRTMGLLAV